jgi:hypothetical protein
MKTHKKAHCKLLKTKGRGDREKRAVVGVNLIQVYMNV